MIDVFQNMSKADFERGMSRISASSQCSYGFTTFVISKAVKETYSLLSRLLWDYAERTAHTEIFNVVSGEDSRKEIYGAETIVIRRDDGLEGIANILGGLARESEDYTDYFVDLTFHTHEPKIKTHYMSIKMYENYIAIKAGHCQKLHVQCNAYNEGKQLQSGDPDITWLYYPDTNTLTEVKRFWRKDQKKGYTVHTDKFFPLSLLMMAKHVKEMDIVRYTMQQIFTRIAENGGGAVYKDIAHDTERCKISIPVAISSFLGAATRKAALEVILKQELPAIANNRSLQHTFYAAKACRYVKDKNEHQKLFGASEEVSDFCIASKSPIKNNVYKFLLTLISSRAGQGEPVAKILRRHNKIAPNRALDHYDVTDIVNDLNYEYIENNEENPDECEIERNIIKSNDIYALIDYMKVAIVLKDINLKRTSVGGYIKEHDRLYPPAAEKQQKKLGAIKIPKNSPYRKLLPPDRYRLLESAGAIIAEGMIQNHCVGMYCDDVRDGKCAIYTTMYAENRYTIEIRKTGKNKKTEYRVNQIRGRYNNTPPEELVNETQKIFDERMVGALRH
jgi:hypothetical protein